MMKKSESSSYTISRLDQLEALKSCVRDRICDVVTQGGTLTVNEIAERLGTRPSALYPHLDLLVEVELIVEHEPVRTGKNFARTFGPRARYLKLDRHSPAPAVRKANNDIVAAQLRQTQREYVAAAELEADADTRSGDPGLRIAWLTAWLDDDARQKADDLLRQLDELFTSDEPGPGKSLYAMTYIARPVKTTR